MDEQIAVLDNWDDFCSSLDKKMIIMSPYCGEVSCEDQIKKMSTREEAIEPGAPAMGAKALCIPFKQPKELSSDAGCVRRRCDNKAKYYTLFRRSY
ncbi:PREDICTED: bifunctional glutamate/proline--tRNA ligase-like [Amphimedon queenslandica]|uniref:Proline-tRNA ligase class II C-terminal domain-containing protein n=1 Tax=Amphimedon queenslandica TaxID=400682 RepID=A0A1X7TD07_AMPQE|nr:PREDICTED: bifunctional glutamate/proline--tRNA ligase-like [Amphimedon queenslandica]|eukprot:XP_019860270.1 PREDICTED: bifunctional glutamate/proline--tRNA ligase-like [Amphimedon queenslandica]